MVKRKLPSSKATAVTSPHWTRGEGCKSPQGEKHGVITLSSDTSGSLADGVTLNHQRKHTNKKTKKKKGGSWTEPSRWTDGLRRRSAGDFCWQVQISLRGGFPPGSAAVYDATLPPKKKRKRRKHLLSSRKTPTAALLQGFSTFLPRPPLEAEGNFPARRWWNQKTPSILVPGRRFLCPWCVSIRPFILS